MKKCCWVSIHESWLRPLQARHLHKTLALNWTRGQAEVLRVIHIIDFDGSSYENSVKTVDEKRKSAYSPTQLKDRKSR